MLNISNRFEARFGIYGKIPTLNLVKFLLILCFHFLKKKKKKIFKIFKFFLSTFCYICKNTDSKSGKTFTVKASKPIDLDKHSSLSVSLPTSIQIDLLCDKKAVL